MKINDAINEGIKRFFPLTQKGQSLPIPTRNDLNRDPELYYPIMCELLKFYGCKYHDSQATVSGRGAKLSTEQKLDGVCKKIASVYLINLDGKTMEKRYD